MTNPKKLSTPDDILKTALLKEKEARQLYSDLSAHTRIEMVRKLADKLKDEEGRHVKLIEDMIAKLNCG